MADNPFFVFEGKEYPLFCKEDSDGKLVLIKGVPLKCPTCPNVSKFKDMSHLITHYGSRDHLKAANETKIRHDLSVPQSVRVYKIYQLWEYHNKLWRWMLETYQRKEDRKIKDESVFSLDLESASGVSNASEGKQKIRSDPTASSSVVPSSVVNLTFSPPPVKTTPTTGGFIPAAVSVEDALDPELSAPIVNQQEVPQDPPKRRRGRPRKNNTTSTPAVSAKKSTQSKLQMKSTKPLRANPKTTNKEPLVMEPVMHEPVVQIDPETNFPVDPRAPKAKPFRDRRVRKAGEPEELQDSDPSLKGKIFPGMSVYNSSTLTFPKDLNDSFIINPEDQMNPLPFNEDGYLLNFGFFNDSFSSVEPKDDGVVETSPKHKLADNDDEYIEPSAKRAKIINQPDRVQSEAENQMQESISLEQQGIFSNAKQSGQANGSTQTVAKSQATFGEDNLDPQLLTKSHTVLEHSNYHSDESSPIDDDIGLGVDLRQQDPFRQMNQVVSETVPTHQYLTRSRHQVTPKMMRTYEGLNADVPTLGWQGSFLTFDTQ